MGWAVLLAVPPPACQASDSALRAITQAALRMVKYWVVSAAVSGEATHVEHAAWTAFQVAAPPRQCPDSAWPH